MILISMKSFILGKQEEIYEDWEQNFKSQNVTYSEFLVDRFIDYAAFLNQSLKVEMFLPCDEEGEILNYNEILESVKEGTESWAVLEKAKERVLFDVGEVEIHEDSVMFGNKRFILSRESGHLIYWKRTAITIEDIANDILVQFKLTDSALKQIGL